MSGGLHVHVGGGVERRTAYNEEQAAIRESLESGTATTVVTVGSGSVADGGRLAGGERRCARRCAELRAS